MATPTGENFRDYKKAEKKALEILAEMRAVTPKNGDIDLGLLVAVVELHKGKVPADTVAAIVQGHLKALIAHYAPEGAVAHVRIY